MSWVFVIASGHVYAPSGALFTTGFAGNNAIGPDMNNPAAEFVKDHGPLPVGGYTMQTPLEGTPLGPCAIPLEPDETNDMQGRSDFFIHDESIAHPQSSSDGCLVTVGVSTRTTMWASPDHRLQVVAEETDVPSGA